jgi:uncharacterized membrane protein
VTTGSTPPAKVRAQAAQRSTGEGTTVAKTDGIFIFVATYPDEAAARADYQVVKDLHAGGLVGSYDAAVVTKDANGKVHENKDETATRHGAWWGIGVGAAVGAIFAPTIIGAAAVGGVVGAFTGHLAKGMPRSTAKELGDFIDPGQAGLLIVGETKIQAAVQKAVTRAEKQLAHELNVDPKDVDKTLKEAVGEM